MIKIYIEVYDIQEHAKQRSPMQQLEKLRQLEAGKTEDAKMRVEAMEAAIEGNLEDDCQIITKDTMQF